MDKVDEAREFLQLVGRPKKQQTDVCRYAILALAGIKQDMKWSEATNNWVQIHEILQFTNTYYGNYAENTRERFRKKAMHEFRTVALI